MDSPPPLPTVSPWPGPETLALDPTWTWWQRDAPDRGYSHAHLLDDRVVGPWFALDRATGELLWQADGPMPNHIFRIQDGTLVATEMLAYGPSTGNYGVYGIDLATGRVAWTHHREGWHVADPEAIELVDLDDDASWRREGPERLTDQGVVTDSGRLLDLATGRQVGTVAPRTTEDYLAEWQPPSTLYLAGAVEVPGLGRLLLGTGETLEGVREHLAEPPTPGFTMMPAHMGRGEPFSFTFESPDGTILWQFDLDADRFWIDGNAYSHREVGRFVVLVVAEPAGDPRAFELPKFGGPTGAPFHAAVLDLASGTIVSRMALGDGPADAAQIEAVDSGGVLFSALFGGDRLFVYVGF